MKLHWFIPLLLGSTSPAAAAIEVLCEQTYETAIKRSILLPPDQFSTEKLLQISREFLSIIGRRRLAELQVFTSHKDAIGHVSSSHPGLPLWLSSYEVERKRKANPFAALTFLNGSAVLKIRFSNARFARHVLVGRDPLLFVVGETNGEILALEIVEVPTFVSEKEGDFFLRVFARTEAVPSVAVGKSVLENLMRSAGVRSASLYLRGDACFIDTPFVPMIYRFEAECPSSAQSIYKQVPSVFCLQVGTISCYPEADLN
jgi:hypothetical protein